MAIPVIEIASIYASEYGRLQKLVSHLVRNRATSEDLVHQVFLKVMAQEEAPNNWPAYLNRAVRNLALNHLRDNVHKSEVSLADHDFSEIADGMPTPEVIALYRSELRRVLKAVAALPIRRREAFVLNKFEGLSYDQIAVRQGISRNTVISQIVSALVDLKHHLDQN